MIFSADDRSIWYSRSDRVCDGATTMLSPVWTPIGSKFSIFQMVMPVSALSHPPVFDLFPPGERALEQNLMDRTGVEPARDDTVELFRRTRHAAAGAAEGERR